MLFCFYVDQLVRKNNFDNCTVIPIGLSDKAQALDLHFASPSDQQATTLADFWTASNTKPFRSRI